MPLARVDEPTLQRVRKLAALEQTTQQELIARALEAFERTVLLDRLNASFARMRDDPRAWREEQRERQVWEGTIRDGLEEADGADG